MKKKVIITGGAGYIGSHTIAELVKDNQFEVVSIDNFCNSNPISLDLLESVCGQKIKNYAVDLCDKRALESIFAIEKDVLGVIHFAAFKSVPESVAHPEKYYLNNINSLINILDICQKEQIRHFLFSSSCSIYGNIESLPVNEQTRISLAESPYAYTKQIGERMLADYTNAYPFFKAMNLRYFNPAGAHMSGMLGELPLNAADNLVPVITKTAIGRMPKMKVFGHQLPTRDGTCIRDYIHVSDIAQAHVKALQYLVQTNHSLNLFTFNVGSGQGVSVLEAIHSFEKVSQIKLNYDLADAREGDVIAIYSDSSLANQELGWFCQYSLDDMMDSAWRWELYQKKKGI